ncbi:MAG: hypothetical protein AB7F19_03280 [Candidatus Babeliales bacterium]
MLYALLKYVGKGVYVPDAATDDCLLALAHFLTDGGSPDQFQDWITATNEGEISGKVTFIEKYGDQMRVSLEPLVTNKKATLVTNKFELLGVINRFNELIADSPKEILIRRDNGKIVLEQKR